MGFADVFTATEGRASGGTDLTINGCHLNEAGYKVFAEALFAKTFVGRKGPAVDEAVRAAVIEKNKQFFRRYRPVNTFYYTGGRRSYGYLDFLPAMRNFDIMVQNQDTRIWDLAQGKAVPAKIDDSNVPPLPATAASAGPING